MSAAAKALDALEIFPASGCRHEKAKEACDCAVDTMSILAAPLAAVARAAMAGYASGGFDRALDRSDEGDQWAHQLVAALDALEAAAAEGGA